MHIRRYNEKQEASMATRKLKCLKCNHIAEDLDFITDYDFGDGLPVFICPRCLNEEEDEIIEEKS